MIYTYKEALSKYKTQFKLEKAVKNDKITKLERGIYTNSDNISDFDYIVKKYPKTIFTMESAFYYHGLTKKKPDKFHLASRRSAVRMKDKNIEQYFQLDKYYNIGVTSMKINSHIVKIYNKERMLIELIRLYNKFDLDYYQEIMHNYYLHKEELDQKKLIRYIDKFKMRKFIIKTINEELEMDLL